MLNYYAGGALKGSGVFFSLGIFDLVLDEKLTLLSFSVRKGSWFWLHIWSWSFRLPFHVCYIKSHECDRSFCWLCDQCSWILSFTHGYIGRHIYPPFITVSYHNITLLFIGKLLHYWYWSQYSVAFSLVAQCLHWGTLLLGHFSGLDVIWGGGWLLLELV